jgi:hypothetical protein
MMTKIDCAYKISKEDTKLINGVLNKYFFIYLFINLSLIYTLYSVRVQSSFWTYILIIFLSSSVFNVMMKWDLINTLLTKRFKKIKTPILKFILEHKYEFIYYMFFDFGCRFCLKMLRSVIGSSVDSNILHTLIVLPFNIFLHFYEWLLLSILNKDYLDIFLNSYKIHKRASYKTTDEMWQRFYIFNVSGVIFIMYVATCIIINQFTTNQLWLQLVGLIYICMGIFWYLCSEALTVYKGTKSALKIKKFC